MKTMQMIKKINSVRVLKINRENITYLSRCIISLRPSSPLKQKIEMSRKYCSCYDYLRSFSVVLYS